MASAKPRQVAEPEEAAADLSLVSPGCTPPKRRRKLKRSPRADKETSGLKPRRLFQESSKAASKRPVEDYDPNDDDEEDDDLFKDSFKQDRKASQLSSRKKKPRKAPLEPEPESSEEGAPSSKQEDNGEAEPEEAVPEEASPTDLSPTAEASEARPSCDSKAHDVRSKFEPELLKLLVAGMASQLVCIRCASLLSPALNVSMKHSLRTDSDHCLRLLLCEDITTLADALELLSDVPAGHKCFYSSPMWLTCIKQSTKFPSPAN